MDSLNWIAIIYSTFGIFLYGIFLIQLYMRVRSSAVGFPPEESKKLLRQISKNLLIEIMCTFLLVIGFIYSVRTYPDYSIIGLICIFLILLFFISWSILRGDLQKMYENNDIQ